MDAVPEEEAEATKDEDVDSETQLLMRSKDTKRKSSISDALNKFTSQHFHRRRTTVDFTSSTSSADPLPPSRLPTPAGLSRSSSFFRNLSAFNPKPTNLLGKDKPAQSVTVKRSAAQPPACRGKASTPHPGHKQQNPSVAIPQHGLMQPIPPGVPRSSTLGNLGHPTSSPHTPGFMRPTSSSAARRQSQSSGFGLSSGTRQPRPARRSSLAQAVSKLYIKKESEREAKQQSKKPINPHEDAAFLLPPAKEADEEQIEYATDEEIEIGTARQMTITPVRSVSSHNPYSDTNFAYGLPNQHDKSKRDSGKPFEHLVVRPVHLERHPPRRDSKPLPTLTPDPNQAPPHNVGHSQEMFQLTGRDSAEYYRRRNSKSLLRAISPVSLGEEFKPEDVYFAEDIEDDDYEEGEGDTVIHRVQGQLLKGSFASASTSEAASDDHDPRSEERDNDLTSSTIKAFPREDDPQKASTLFPSHPSRPFPSQVTPSSYYSSPSAFCSLLLSPFSLCPHPPHTQLYTNAPSHVQITAALPSATWLGRVTSLSDRFRSEALAESMNALPALSIHNINSPTHIPHPMHDDNRRYHRVFMHLHGLCETDEARNSLRQFQQMWEGRRLREYGGGSGAVGLAFGGGGGYTTGETKDAGVGGTSGSSAGKSGVGSGLGVGGSGKVKDKKGMFEKLGLRRKSGL